MKKLIVYFSFTNNNKLLSEHLTAYLDADIFRITEPHKRTDILILMDILFNQTPKINPLAIDWSKYDHTILIAPIYDYAIAHPMKTFIQQEKDNIGNYSFLTLCIGREGQKQKIINQLKIWLGRKPETVEEFLINDLVSPEQIEKIRYGSHYTIKEEEMKTFEPQIKATTALISSASSISV